MFAIDCDVKTKINYKFFGVPVQLTMLVLNATKRRRLIYEAPISQGTPEIE